MGDKAFQLWGRGDGQKKRGKGGETYGDIVTSSAWPFAAGRKERGKKGPGLWDLTRGLWRGEGKEAGAFSFAFSSRKGKGGDNYPYRSGRGGTLIRRGGRRFLKGHKHAIKKKRIRRSRWDSPLGGGESEPAISD